MFANRPIGSQSLLGHIASIVAAILLLAAGNQLRAAAPSLVNYQGYLVDGVGDPLTGSFNLTFSIWDTESAGTQLWTESHTGVNVVDGAFSVLLGSLTPVTDAIFSDTVRYLQINLGGEDILPRTRLVSVPYALRTGTLDGAIAGTINGPLVIKPSDFDSVGNGIIILNNNGNPQLAITVNGNDVASVAIIEPEDSKSGRAVGNKVMELNHDGVFLFGLTESDTTAVMMPNGDIRASNSISVGSGNSNTGDYANVFGFNNSASGDSSVVSGGYNNTASGFASTIAGGHDNTTSGVNSVVSGGIFNSATNGLAVVGGGALNLASGNASVVSGGNYDTATAQYAVIGGGLGNYSAGVSSVVGGGSFNRATSLASTISGGYENEATYVGAFVGGGYRNKARGQGSVVAGGGSQSGPDSNVATANASWATICGGDGNTVSWTAAAIGGGNGNTASAYGATVSGGSNNTASGQFSSIMGGTTNIASGKSASVGGGHYCIAGGDNSFAAGSNAHASHNGSIVFSAAYSCCSTTDSIASGGNDQFVVRAEGGIYLTRQTTAGVAPYDATKLITTQGGAYFSGTGNTWTNSSDKNQKENFEELDRRDLLSRIAQLPITRWNYKDEGSDVTHIGPMAQDFSRLFGVGANDVTISTVDPAGIALAAIQVLDAKTQELENKSKEVDELRSELEAVKAMLQKLIDEND